MSRTVARAALGHALGARASEIVERTLTGSPALPPGAPVPSQAYLEHREVRTLFGTLLVARYLITGEAASEGEKEWIGRGGAMAAAEGLTMALTTRGYYIWRDSVLTVLREEAGRLDAPRDVLEEALEVARASCDSSVFRMARSYDHHLRHTNAELAAASQFKSEFLAKMSHELRTPLSAIIGFSEVLLEGVDGELTAEQRADVDLIHESGRSLLELINDVLDLSKIEAGRMELKIEELELAPIVESVLTTLAQPAEAKSLAVTAHVDPAAGRVLGDPLRVRQVVTNLVSNAIKFTAQGSVVIKVEPALGGALVSVSDTGIGIAGDALGRIFDEFRQADREITRRYGGTGLGLAISRKLVEMQGGSMGVTSEPGLGSRFWFTLPVPAAVETASDALPAAEPPPVHDWAGQTRDLVLVVDDEPAMRRLIVRRLEEEGFATAEAATAKAAIQLARELHPAAVTLDIMLAGDDGWAVLSDLKTRASTRDIPVVVVSVVGGRELALDLGAIGYVPKPISKHALISAMREVLPAVKGAHVLCVDDEPATVEAARRALTSAGIDVALATSAEEALRILERDVPDAIFVDLTMPRMSGFELVSRLRSRPALASVPLIVLSARHLDQEDRAALNGHVDRVIAKGNLRLSDLSATVRQTIAHRRTWPPRT